MLTKINIAKGADMTVRKTHHSVVGENRAKTMFAVDAISPERATDYAKRLFEMRSRGWGDGTDALEDVAGRCGMSPRGFKRLMEGKTKEPGLRIFSRVRMAYLDYCHNQIKRLQAQIEIEREIDNNAAFEDLGSQVEALSRKVEAAKSIHVQQKRNR